jgi:chromosomal replication initiator protein
MSVYAAEKLSGAESVWQEVLQVIKENVSGQSFTTWFVPIQYVELNEHQLELLIPNRFFCEWIEKHYSRLIQNAVVQVLGESRKIKFSVRNESTPGSPYQSTDWKQTQPVIERLTPLPKSIYHTPINERYVFDNFIIGDSNRFAYAACQAVASAPGKTNYNPLIIYGGTGLGKTHLIQAIGNYAIRKQPGITVHYTSSETFTSHFINSIQQNKVSEFSGFYRSCDILLLDDIHFFSNKGKTQEEFFHTFNDLHQTGKQIVLTSDRPINELVALEERLISRFKWGLVADVQPPDYETRLAILRNKCDESGLAIPAEVLEYLAVNLKDNVRELEGALTKIMAQVTFTAIEPNLELARKIVAEISRPDRSGLTIDRIMEYSAQIHGLPPDHLRAKTRRKEIVKARQVAMYLAKELTSHSLITIGLHFGGRDHTTVIHAVKCVTEDIQKSASFRQQIDVMRKHLEYNR